MKIYYYIRALLLFSCLWDVCWWHYNQKYAEEVDFYVCDRKTAWEVARGIWIK